MLDMPLDVPAAESVVFKASDDLIVILHVLKVIHIVACCNEFDRE